MIIPLRKILTFLLIIILLAVIAGYIWLQVKNKPGWQPGGDVVAALETKVAQLQDQVQAQNGIIRELQKNTVNPQLNALASTDPDLIAIAKLVKMADFILLANDDVKGAIDLLTTARQYAGTKYVAINYALTKDIATLQAATKVDLVNLLARLDVINQQIFDLPLLPQQKSLTAALPPAPTTMALPLWRKLGTSILTTLKELVIVRHHVVEPLPLPEQMLTVRLNIQAKILQAEWAAIHKNNQLYQSCLVQISDWIARYFALNGTNANTVLNTLKELQKINVQTQIPGLQASLPAIQDVTKPATTETPAPPKVAPQPINPPPQRVQLS